MWNFLFEDGKLTISWGFSPFHAKDKMIVTVAVEGSNRLRRLLLLVEVNKGKSLDIYISINQSINQSKIICSFVSTIYIVTKIHKRNFDFLEWSIFQIFFRIVKRLTVAQSVFMTNENHYSIEQWRSEILKDISDSLLVVLSQLN